MATTISIDPFTRIEGHLEIEATVESVAGRPQVVAAHSSGTMFRGFEMLMVGRDPRDAVHYTQRICGVCPISHAMASSLTLEQALRVTPLDAGRIARNLVLGSNFIQSHVLHFYHLTALDYLDTTGSLKAAPWMPRYTTPDMISGTSAKKIVEHYVQALEIRRKAHQLAAIFGGKMPCASTFCCGGNTQEITAENVSAFRSLLNEIRTFVNDVYIPDVKAVAAAFSHYFEIGQGCGNLLSYGVFDLDAAGDKKVFPRGRYTAGERESVDLDAITEHVKHSWYTNHEGDQRPAENRTQPQAGKDGAYSWIKSPRYANGVHELGPLARMWMSGDYTNGISVLDRLMARALETAKIIDAMNGWLNELEPGAPTCAEASLVYSGQGVGLTEAPRGALGHWLTIDGGVISRYQVLTPTAWNASPMDDFDQPGPLEQALVGTEVADASKPIELMRVVHSFDPCLACSVHALTPSKEGLLAKIVIPAMPA